MDNVNFKEMTDEQLIEHSKSWYEEMKSRPNTNIIILARNSIGELCAACGNESDLGAMLLQQAVLDSGLKGLLIKFVTVYARCGKGLETALAPLVAFKNAFSKSGL